MKIPRQLFALLACAVLAPATRADTGTGLSGNITVDTRGASAATAITVTGRVLSRATETVLVGATVSLAGRTAMTAANGSFSLANVDLGTGSTVTISLVGYLSQSQTVSAPAGAKSLVLADVSLPLSTTKPVVEWFKADLAGLFLPGLGLSFAGTARVNWNGNTPGDVRFYANGQLVATKTGAGPEYAVSLAVDQIFTPSLLAGRNKVSVIATSAQDSPSDALENDVVVLHLPGSLFAYAVNPSNVHIDAGEVSIELSFPKPALKRTVSLPFIGPLEAEFQAKGSFKYSILSGEWEVALGEGESAGHVRLGDWQGGVMAEIRGKGTATVNGGIRLNELVFRPSLSLSGTFPIGRITPWGFLSTGSIAIVPGLEDALKPLSIAMNVKPNLTGTAEFQLEPNFAFNNLELTGKLALEAAYEMEILEQKVKLYAGGEPGVTFQIPGDLFKEINFRVYAGLEITTWVLKRNWEVVFVDVHYPSVGANLLAVKRGNATEYVIEAAGNRVAEWKPLIRYWREIGPERFVSGPAVDALSSENAAQSAALDVFRRMGNALPLGAAGVPKSSGLTFTSNVIASAPRLPAQTTLPLLANVFPDSEPSLAGRASELMLLYVRDRGVANPVQYTEIAFTHFDGTNWSTPAAVASDPRAQFAPQVVFDGAGNAVAVWEQIRDAAFVGTDPQAMAAQMEIMTSRWNPATQTWTAPVALMNNAVVDHGPRMSGPMTDGDLMLTWIQNDSNLLTGTGVPGAATNSRVMTMRWDSATATWGAAGTLVANLTNELSGSLAASGNKAVYLWSKDLDGNLDDLADTELFYRVYDASTGLWGSETRYTNDAIADKNAKVVLNATGGVYAVWQRGSDLVMDRNFAGTPAAVRADSTTMGFADFALTLGPGGNVLAIWQEMSDAGSDAHYRVFDPASNTWSLDTLLSNDAALERSFAPVWDAVGNLVLAYNNVAIVKQTKTVAVVGGGTIDIPGVPQPGQVDLFAARRALVKDLGFGTNGLTATGATFLPGDAVTLKAKARNTGNVAVQNVQLAFYDGNPTSGGTLIQTVTIPGWLKSSDEQEVSVVWTVPSPATAHMAFAVVDPAGLVTEFSETNNTSSLALNGVDLQLECVSGSVLRDGSVRVVARVKNIGAPASPATSLKLWPKLAPGPNPLASVEVSLLNPGGSVEIPIDLPAGSQPEGDLAYRLTVDEDNLAVDIERTNNEIFFALNLFIDDDGDGIARAWEIANGLSDSNAADASQDRDRDGFTNRQEYFAGTNPNDGNSYLKVGQFNVLQKAGGTGFISTVSWASVAGRQYRVERSFDLASWQVAADNLEATPPLNSVTDDVSPPNGKVFYRVVAK